MKTFLLILLISFQARTDRYIIDRRCDSETNKCEKFYASLRVNYSDLWIKHKNVDLRFDVVKITYERGETIYFLKRDTTILDTTYILSKGAAIIYPQYSDTDGKKRPSDIKIQFVVYTEPPEFFHATYRYIRKEIE